MERHSRYLELRLAQCLARPELHRHQIPVLRELIALAKSGIEPPEYNRRANHLFGLTQAEWRDRYSNLAHIHNALGDERMQRGARIFHDAADANNFAEFSVTMTRSMIAANGVQLAATTAADSLAPLTIALLHWATESAPRTQAVLAQTLKGLWRVIQHNDPGCSWQRICTYPPYRNRLPFDDEGLKLIGSWLRRAVGTQLADVPQAVPYDPGTLPIIATPDAPELPSVKDAAHGYHLAYDHAKQHGSSSVLPVYEQIFDAEAQATCANDFLCRITAADLICELSRAQHYDVATDALAHCNGLSQPLVELHYTSLVAALKRATSATELDYEVARHEACFAVESAWHHIFIAYVFRTLTTVMTCELDPSESRYQTVRNSYAVTQQLFGDWDATFAIPRVWQFFSAVFFDHGQELVEPPAIDGIYRGEVGLDLLGAFRAHALQHVVDFVSSNNVSSNNTSADDMDLEVQRLVNSRRFATPQQMRKHITALFHAAMAGTKSPENDRSSDNRGVIFWRKHVLFEALEGVLSSPPRPC